MKKLFTVDDLIVAGISGIGYGLGFEIPKILGYAEWQCGLICLIVGATLDKLANVVVFSKVVQSSTANRIMLLLAYILVGTAIQYYFVSWKISVDDYAMEGYAYLIVPAILGFAFSMALRRYRVRKIRRLYGDGSNGFLFDELLKRKDFLAELNGQNQPIHGEFDENLAVKTKTGVFVGDRTKDSIYFCGIPYAKPPIGARRWKAPEPLPKSDDVFEAKYFGASAIQVDYDGSPLKHHRQSEDCLYLNICTGRKKTNKKKPVVVIFHHGDFSYGGSADPVLYGNQFIQTYPDVVGVTFNYRLGILGFIDFSEVPGGEDYPDALNLGLLDQIAALRWIKENISAFGGDPEQITVMGFESGTLSISVLATCEQAKGLFQKAFIFCGSPLLTYETHEPSRNLARELMKETSTTTMEELLQLSTEQLKEVTQKLVMSLSTPTRDEKLIPLDVYEKYLNGIVSNVEFMVGIPSDESQIYKSYVGGEKYEDFIFKEYAYILKYLDYSYPAEAKDVRTYIEKQTAATSELEAIAKVVEQLYALSTYQCAKKLVEGGSKVHLFYWNVNPLIENLGSGTVDVLTTFLGNHEVAQIYGNVMNPDVAATLQNLFRKFESGKELRLFNNEIKGISAIDWKEFPLALVVSEKSFRCEDIADKLTEIKSLLKVFT